MAINGVNYDNILLERLAYPFNIQREITDWPDEVTCRTRLGNWESDTVFSKRGEACLTANTDRKIGCFVGSKASKKFEQFVIS